MRAKNRSRHSLRFCLIDTEHTGFMECDIKHVSEMVTRARLKQLIMKKEDGNEEEEEAYLLHLKDLHTNANGG